MKSARAAAYQVLGIALLGLLLALIGARLARYDLAFRPADPAAGRTLQQFEDVERNRDTSFAWSRPRAALAFFGLEGRSLLLDLRLASPRPADAPAAVLTLGEGVRVYGRFAVGGDWRHYRMLLPPRSTNERAITLESPPFDPSGADARDLGVALSALRVATLPPGGWWPGRALYLAAWPALLALALKRRPAQGFWRWLRLGLPLFGLLLVPLAAAFPQLSSYLLPTIWPLPLVLLLPWLPWLLRRGTAWLRQHRQRALTLGLLLAALGQGLIVALAAPRWGAVLLGLGALLVALALPAPARQPLRKAQSERIRGLELFAVAAISLLALLLRLYHLDSLPLGLFRDEARHGLQALRIWYDPGYRPVYVVYGAQLPALLFYLVAPLVGLLGPAAWVVRLVPALAGALTPLALWWFARPIWGPAVALLAATLLAVASWALNMSRWGFPVSLDPLLMTLALGLLWRGLRPGSWQARAAFCLLSGACAGLAAYAYHNGRFGPLVLALAAALLLGRKWAAWRRALPFLAIVALAGLLVLLPLLRFIVSDFGGYTYRVERVQLFKDRLTPPNTPLGGLADNLLRYMAMWQVEGDANGRHHLPRAPMLDPLSGTLLLVGLLLLLRRPARAPTLLLLSWLVVGLVPGIFSIEAPHAMRSFDALAPACVIAALGGVALWQQRASFRPAIPHRLGPLLAAGLLAFCLAWNSWMYFEAFGRSPVVYERFDVVETFVGRALRKISSSGDPTLRDVQLLLARKLAGRDVVEFLAAGLRFGRCDQGRCVPAPAPESLLLIDGAASAAERAAALRALGAGAVFLGAGPRYPDSDQPIFLAYGVGPAAQRAFALIQNSSP